jgi:uncharacterized membrane protein
VGSAKRKFGAVHGGSVRMFGVAATSGKIERQASRRLPRGMKGCQHDVALAGVSLALTAAIFSHIINPGLSPAFVIITLLSVTLFGVAARLAVPKRLHRQQASRLISWA